MDKYIKTSRIGFLSLLLAVLLTVYTLTLYKLQILEGSSYLAANTTASGVVSTTQTVHAARGSILDRNGVLLVSDRTVYDVRISRSQLLQQEDRNDILLTLIRAAEAYGVSYTDTFPVTKSAPFEYYAGATTTQKTFLQRYFQYFTNSLSIEDPENPNVTATELVSWMREHYGIPYTVTAEDARKIIGVRYGLELQAIVYSDYVFAKDIPTEFLTYISEQHLPSVSIETRSERVYHTDYAAHILGRIGSIDPDEVDSYRELGYPLNSLVGKSGAEAAFEQYLHGSDGEIVVYTDATGAVTDIVTNSTAAAGSNVYLTIDLTLQQAAEDALASTIEKMNLDRTAAAEAENEDLPEGETPVTPELATGGAVVVLDAKSGDVLAMASYPEYSISSWNRATNGTYNPGSTFKLVTAMAALRSGTISRWTLIHDDVTFTKYQELGYSPSCWIIRQGSHGNLNVVGAIENSCNYFFFAVADEMGIDVIAEVAREFGFGAPTGIEIGESAGLVASREQKQETLHEGWWAADTLLACIGQGLNEFTPVQLAAYTAAIANGGTLYSTTILKNISSFDYSDVILERDPQVKNVVSDPEGYIPVLQTGMRAVASTGTAASALSGYKVSLAAKTGTVQSDTSRMNDGVFICYAPADDPEIAIAVVVEKGGSGSAIISVATQILDAYFTSSDVSGGLVTDNTLVR